MLPLPYDQTIYSREQWAAMINAKAELGSLNEYDTGDKIIAPPMDLDQEPYLDSNEESYTEEEANIYADEHLPNGGHPRTCSRPASAHETVR